jgi:hypothetical protein
MSVSRRGLCGAGDSQSVGGENGAQVGAGGTETAPVAIQTLLMPRQPRALGPSIQRNPSAGREGLSLAQHAAGRGAASAQHRSGFASALRLHSAQEWAVDCPSASSRRRAVFQPFGAAGVAVDGLGGAGRWA